MNRTLVLEPESNPVVSGVLAVMVHVLFFTVLTLGINWQRKITLPMATVELWREAPASRSREPDFSPPEREPARPPRAVAKAEPPKTVEPPRRTEIAPPAPARIAMPTASRPVMPAAGTVPAPPSSPPANITPPASQPAVAALSPPSASPVRPGGRPAPSEPTTSVQPRAPQPSTSAPLPPAGPSDIAVAPRHTIEPESTVRPRLPGPAAVRAPSPTQQAAAPEALTAPRLAPEASVPAMTGPHRPRAALTPAPATAPARPADQAALPDHSAPAAPQLGPDPRRPITDVAAAPARSGPSSARAAEPQAELAARSRELAQEQRRQEALRLAQQLPDEDTDQLREQAERDASAVRTESQKRRKSAKARELAAATASTKTGPQVDAQALASEQSLMNSYMAQISAAVRKKVVMPPDVRDNPEAVYEVALIPGGEVVRTRLRKSSGQPAYDIAVERAIRAAEPLPVPDDPALFDQHFRTFVLRFRPVE